MCSRVSCFGKVSCLYFLGKFVSIYVRQGEVKGMCLTPRVDGSEVSDSP